MTPGSPRRWDRVTALDHLTLLGVPPPVFVTLAAGAGFDAVGLRISPATAGESRWPMAPGSPMLLDTVRRCQDSGVRVLDTETIRLTARGSLAASEEVIETAALLGAGHLTVIGDDPDLARLSDHFCQLAQMSASYGVRAVIEFMAYKTVRTLGDAMAIAARSDGGGVLLDALHIQRCGVGIEQIARIEPKLLSYVQLCDAPLQPPGGPVARPGRGHVPDDRGAIEARTQRLLPGEGELPLAGLLSALPAALPVAVEAPRTSPGLPAAPAEFAVRARQSLDRVLMQWRHRHSQGTSAAG
jgi:sugar phosphate isomerase/epimerase